MKPIGLFLLSCESVNVNEADIEASIRLIAYVLHGSAANEHFDAECVFMQLNRIGFAVINFDREICSLILGTGAQGIVLL